MSTNRGIDDTTRRKRKTRSSAAHGKCMLTRRQFLLYSGGTAMAASTVSLGLFPGSATATTAKVVGYPRKLIAKLSELKDNVPVDFNYPDDLGNSSAMIVKMGGVPAGGGLGSQRDVVAYNYLCTHQGGPLQGSYVAEGAHRILGQCPLHLSTYDLTRHGIVISGQAYESLPQVLLELDGDDIYAVGMMGLIFGRHKNLLES
ncbi:Arsenite oxidase small subunit precursor [hydrothermal vent metagenome]|uniref:Arsenite oxidase small subunit n=1 Tax=hydrothermal vent metagenome TaxID=652676 RepID=A0A3B1ATP7_9ZZZZ